VEIKRHHYPYLIYSDLGETQITTMGKAYSDDLRPKLLDAHDRGTAITLQEIRHA
jgi:hypothetical protein